jgi:formate dehydrogenase major subunit
VFAGGDAVSGPASVIEALAHGKRAAGSIDRFLMERDGLALLKDRSRIRYSMKEPADNEREMKRERPGTSEVGKRVCDAEVVRTLGRESAARECKRCFRCDLSSEEVL